MRASTIARLAVPFTTDPLFYAAPIAAVILLGVSKSGFGAGSGALAVPTMALAVTGPEAAAILMPVLLVLDCRGLAVYRRQFEGQLLRLLLPFAPVGVFVGLRVAHRMAPVVFYRITTTGMLLTGGKLVWDGFPA